MLEPLLGSTIREYILVYLTVFNEGYPRQIARFYHTDISQIQKQMERLEKGGIVQCRTIGRTRLYRRDPDYPLYDELERLVRKAIGLYPETERERLLPSSRSVEYRYEPLSVELL